MIVNEPNQFINNCNQTFIVPDGIIDDYGLTQIVEFKNKVILSFVAKDDDTNNAICFDRKTGEILWQIEPPVLWEIKQKHFIRDIGMPACSYLAIYPFAKSLEGSLWVEELYNLSHCKKHTNLEEKGAVGPHPDYFNNEIYKYINYKSYSVKKDGHKLVPRDLSLSSENRKDFCGALPYTDMTEFDEKDCILVAMSSYVFYFEVNLETGKVKPAYAFLEYTK